MQFFERPILNSPYAYPDRHWQLDDYGRPTDRIVERRRRAELTAPVPEAKKRGKRSRAADQTRLDLRDIEGVSTEEQEYNQTILNDLRQQVDAWRALPNPADWQVSPETARLLKHWRDPAFQGRRPFFCQVEAVETAIWLAEVAPKSGKRGKQFAEYLSSANESANPGLFRVALKLATGAGKTTVMAMLIAWQAVNAIRHPNTKSYSSAFLIIAPGITIRDRLRVLLPNDPESIYRTTGLVPMDLLPEINKARIVITNYHAFKLRERTELSKGGRAALEGHGGNIATLETEGQMIQRVMGDLMGSRNIVVLNDEAHHCYRERPKPEDEPDLKGDDRKEAEENNEAARLWISGIEAAKRQLGVRTVYDLSATPFFLKGSGWREGALFPWVMSDFALIDAVECGIVKLPRVPVADNLPSGEEPLYRDLWAAIGKKMPKKAKGEKKPDPLKLPPPLQTALQALYGHYEKVYRAWEEAKIGVPPVFIIVCNNTTNSELLRDFVAGFRREDENGLSHYHAGRCELFRNFNDSGEPITPMRTLLIDSERIDSGEQVDSAFKQAAAAQIEEFRREKAAREGAHAAQTLTDEEILREVMNTVGRKGKLGEQIRCVVSVSMLTEGWDANTVTHILGLRAFGTRLICEQVMGRALRRLNYDLNEDGLFNTEYADIMGIDGLNFAEGAVVVNPKPPREMIHVHAVSPDRDHLEITFPRVEGYRQDLPQTRLKADFSTVEPYELTPEKVGPTNVTMQGILGMPEHLTVEHLRDMRRSSLIYNLGTHLLEKMREPGEEADYSRFGQCRSLVRQWLDADLLRCRGETFPAQLCIRQLGDEVTDIILSAITSEDGEPTIRAILDPYNPTGTTADVSFTTSKEDRWSPDPRKAHLNWHMLDSGWEGQMCDALEQEPRVIAYTKNHNLGFEIPYLHEGEPRRYRPDFIARIDTGGEPLNLIIEVKGYRGEDAKLKKLTAEQRWVPGVNRLGRHGRWAFAELREVFDFKERLAQIIDEVAS